MTDSRRALARVFLPAFLRRSIPWRFMVEFIAFNSVIIASWPGSFPTPFTIASSIVGEIPGGFAGHLKSRADTCCMDLIGRVKGKIAFPDPGKARN
jgi:hypothetical protein